MKKRKKKQLNFPCSCGHSKRSHKRADLATGNEEWCNVTRYCACEQYVPDNLKYLEKIFNKKKSK